MAIDPKTLKAGDRFRANNWPKEWFCEVIRHDQVSVVVYDEKGRLFMFDYNQQDEDGLVWNNFCLVNHKTNSHKEELAKIASRLAEIANET